MTTAPALQLDRHPLAPPLRPGDIVWTWCSRAGDRTDHVYQPGKTPPLKCLCPVCSPELHKTVEDTATI